MTTRNLPLEVLHGHRAKLVREIEERREAIDAIDRTLSVLNVLGGDPVRDALLASVRKGYAEVGCD